MQEKGDPFGPPYSSLLWSVHVLQNYFVHPRCFRHRFSKPAHFPFLRILPVYALRRRFAFRRVLLYLCSANKDKGLFGPFFRTLKDVLRFGRPFFLSPKP